MLFYARKYLSKDTLYITKVIELLVKLLYSIIIYNTKLELQLLQLKFLKFSNSEWCFLNNMIH